MGSGTWGRRVIIDLLTAVLLDPKGTIGRLYDAR